MPLDPDFVRDALYGPEALFIDEILEIDASKNLVRARLPTHDDLPLTRHQRVHPLRHPRHVAGGLMVHLTGVMGYAHFYFVLNKRCAEGWTGFGARIHDARFSSIARPGEPMVLEVTATRVRAIGPKILARYAFRFTQGEALIYTGDQTAMWMKVEGDGPIALEG